ncbi:ABC transporter substrate-binding protein [Sulfurospirillum arcachonense]|uniref:ABC transporter substrate-binding protein n=1 Tax=Sulfurospirillum arcachonense TaxID=57666 RepID=UPI00046A2CE2|nr:ABC transporter substrate-binding protein [Sulfurospirillum arcachonense]
MKKMIMGLATVALLFSAGNAATLKVGLASGAGSMDPYAHNETATNSILSNIFDALISFDKDLKTHPALAVSWTNPEPTVWLMKLRKGVKFHNGSDFNADDVVFSYDRVKNWDKSGFKGKVSMIKEVSKVDDFTVKIVTNVPYPILLRKLTYIHILDKETLEGKSEQWIGLHAIGTGPYKLVSWSKGDHIKLDANPTYWQGKGKYDKVLLRPLTNNATRVAAILSNEVDIINRVPVVDVNRVKANDKLDFFVQPGLRLIYLQMDQDRDKSPYIKSHDGKNPLKDIRVRRALYYGINEDAIIKYVMKTFAKPASQLSPEAVFGYDPSIKTRVKYDPKKAKALLAEAGYPDGFEIVLDAPNNRYINDSQIAQAIASSLAKIGITVKVNATPKSTFFAETGKLNTSFFLIGWASSDGDASSIFDGVVHTFDKDKGYGRYNRGRFSSPKADKLIEKSAGIMDPNERLKVLQEAQRVALVEEQCFIPLHYQVDIYAASKKVHFEPRTDSRIWAFDIK